MYDKIHHKLKKKKAKKKKENGIQGDAHFPKGFEVVLRDHHKNYTLVSLLVRKKVE